MGVSFAEAGGHLKEVLDDQEVNFVVLSTQSGYGHNRQARHVVEFLRSKKFLGQKRVFSGEIPIKKSDGIVGLVDRFYALTQNYPVLDVFSKLLEMPGMDRLIDEKLRKAAKPDLVEEMVKGSKVIDPGLPTVIIATHGIAGESGVLWDGKKLGEIEAVPDKWKDKKLYMLTTPDTEANHVTIVHDQETEAEMRRIGRGKGRTILAWGTLTNPNLINDPDAGRIWDGKRPVKVLAQLSGNAIPKYTDRILEWIGFEADRIGRGELIVRVHALNHEVEWKRIKERLEKLGLTDRVKVYYEKTKKKAIKNLEWCLRGKYDVDICKGEKTYENICRRKTAAVVSSVGHELESMQAAIEAGYGINLIDVPVSRWTGEMENNLAAVSAEPPPFRENWSLLAIGMLVDPEYFSKIVI